MLIHIVHPNNHRYMLYNYLIVYYIVSSYIQLNMLNYTVDPSNRFYMWCSFRFFDHNLSNTIMNNLLHMVPCSLLSNNRFYIYCMHLFLYRMLLLNNMMMIHNLMNIYFHSLHPNNRSYMLCIRLLLRYSYQYIHRCICFHSLDPNNLCCI